MKASELIQTCKDAMQLSGKDPEIKTQSSFGIQPVENITLDGIKGEYSLIFDIEIEGITL